MTKKLPPPADLPEIEGRYTVQAPLGRVGWFRTGGHADILFKPHHLRDLQSFLAQYSAEKPVVVLGVLSNSIIRDGGIDGVVIRLGREFAGIAPIDNHVLYVGAAALDVNVAEAAAAYNLAGLEFLCGIPGSIGGALALNAGAYGGELKDCLVRADFVDRAGNLHSMTADDLKMGYRHSEIPQGWIAVGAALQARPGNRDDIIARMNEIRTKRAASQPIRAQTGGSTFKNPAPEKLEKVGLDPDL